MEISTEDFDRIVDVDIGIDVTLRRKNTITDPNYGSMISNSIQDIQIKVIWEEITGEEENFRPEGELKIGDIKCFTKSTYEGLIPSKDTDLIVKNDQEYKIIKITNWAIADKVIYRILQLRLK